MQNKTARVFHDLGGAGSLGPHALTIGNFDGVHEGHRRIFRRVAEIARKQGWIPAVLTFDPHPTRIVAPDRAPRLLSLPEERPQWMSEEGIEQVFILPFNSEFSQLEPEAFVRRILIEGLDARAVLVGDNFRFGYRASGDIATLERLSARYGYLVEIMHAVTLRRRVVSSSEIRRLIDAGQVSLAWRFLDRPYALEGEVVRGQGIGSKQTVPTLNLATSAEIIPRRGVYVTRTREAGGGERQWESVTNVGYRPTFGGQDLSIETFLLSPLEPPTPERIRVEFLHRLRDERKFDTPEQLKTQILTDARRTLKFFRLLRFARPDAAASC